MAGIPEKRSAAEWARIAAGVLVVIALSWMAATGDERPAVAAMLIGLAVWGIGEVRMTK